MENEDSHAQAAANEPSTTEETPAAGEPERVCRIGEGLKEVRQCYDDVRHKAAGHLREARETTLGDVFDRVFATVKRHPCGSLAVAATLGFFLGRLFRR